MIIVSGGPGFIGAAVVAELLRRGERVGVLGRDEAKIRARFGEQVTARVADVRDDGALVTAFAGAEVVINAVQFTTSPIEIPRRGWTFEAVDYKGTLSQVAAVKAAGGGGSVSRVGAGAALRPGAPNQLFEIGGPQVMTMDEVLRTALSVMGRRRFILHQPVFFGRALGRLASLLPTPPLTADAGEVLPPPAVAGKATPARGPPPH